MNDLHKFTNSSIINLKVMELVGLKRLLLPVILLLILIGCSNNVSKEAKLQLEEMINSYNGGVEILNDGDNDLPEIEKIDSSNLNELRKEKNGYWQTLYESDFIKNEGTYTVEVKYDNKKNIKGYHIGIKGDPEKEHSHYTNRGIATIAILVNALELDIYKYQEKFSEMLSSDDELIYNDNKYEISFLKMDEFDSLFINFDKLE